MRRLLVLSALAASAPVVTLAQPTYIPRGPIVVASPNKQLIATIAPAGAAANASRWRYRLDRSVAGARVEVLGWSPLGVVRDDASLVELTVVSATAPIVAGDEYQQLQGKVRTHKPASVQTAITLATPGGARLILDVRVGQRQSRASLPISRSGCGRSTCEGGADGLCCSSRQPRLAAAPRPAGKVDARVRELLRGGRRRRGCTDAAGLVVSRAVQDTRQSMAADHRSRGGSSLRGDAAGGRGARRGVSRATARSRRGTGAGRRRATGDWRRGRCHGA